MAPNLFGWLPFGRGSAPRSPCPFPPDTPIQAVRYVVLDTEFTSLDKRSNRLLSVGAVRMEGSSIRVGEQFYRVLNPGVEVPASTVVVHKLRPADIEQGEQPSQVLADLKTFVSGAILVGHFIRIDVDILTKELHATEHTLENPFVCTAQVHRWLLRKSHYSEDMFHRLENVDLASLARLYKIDYREAHHALDDAFVTARLWQKLIHELEARGIRTLAELLRIGRP